MMFDESLTKKVLSEQIPFTFQIGPTDIFMFNLSVDNSPTQFQDKFPVLVLGDFVLVHLQKHCGLAVEYPSLSPVTQPTLFIQMNLFE